MPATSKLARRTRRSWSVALTALVALSALGCDGSSPPPTPPLLAGVVAVTAGGNHACARLADGTARCWGDDAFGELGDDAMWTRPPGMPVAVNLPGIVGLAAGGSQTCAVLGDATVSCWETTSGESSATASGRSTTYARAGSWADRRRRHRRDRAFAGRFGSRRRVQLRLADERPGFLLGQRRRRCVGGRRKRDRRPLAGRGLGTDRRDAAGAGRLACLCAAQRSNRRLLGQRPLHLFPDATGVAGVSDVAELATGSVHACALFVNGTVSCWGDHTFGQIGDGMTSLDLATPPPGWPASPASLPSRPRGITPVPCSAMEPLIAGASMLTERSATVRSSSSERRRLR